MDAQTLAAISKLPHVAKAIAEYERDFESYCRIMDATQGTCGHMKPMSTYWKDVPEEEEKAYQDIIWGRK